VKKNIAQYCESRCLEFGRIDKARKEALDELSAYLKYKKGEEVNLLIIEVKQRFVGHLLRIWLQMGADYFKYPLFSSLCVGMAKQEIETNWLHIMLNIGFDIECKDEKGKPVYSFYSSENQLISCQSMEFDESYNWPSAMACFSEDGLVLPDFETIIEFEQNFSYPDSAWAEGSSREEEVLHKLIGQVAREMLYVFSNVNADSNKN
jgi:hypothetical protein